MNKPGLVAILALLFAFALAASATSYRDVDWDCPLCGKKVEVSVLASYSNFGRAPRDLSSAYGHRNVTICPFDGYAAYQGEWRDLDDGEKTRLKAFLSGDLKTNLSDAERIEFSKDGVSKHDRSYARELLWARTCSEFRNPDPRRDFNTALLLFYRSAPSTEPFFRARAIEAIGRTLRADWISKPEKPVFEYLRGELLRQAGRNVEARAAFDKLLTKRPAPKPAKEGDSDEEEAEGDQSWVYEWAEEQRTRMAIDQLDVSELSKRIIPELPDLYDEHLQLSFQKRIEHLQSIERLFKLMKDGDELAGKAVNDLIKRDVDRLLVLSSMGSTNHITLRKDPELLKWLGELLEQLAAKPEKSEDRQLRQLLGNQRWGDSWPLHHELIPHFERWRKDRTLAALPAGWGWRQGLEAYHELFNDYGSNNAPDKTTRLDAMAAFIQILPSVPDKLDDWSWPLSQGLSTIAEHRKNFAETLGPLLGKKWQGTFWKSTTAYINGTGKTAALRESKLLGVELSDAPVYENFLWDLFGTMQDPVWMERATKMLEEEKWVYDDIYSYLGNFPASDDELLPKITARLEKLRAAQAEKTPPEWFFEYEIRDAQDWLEFRWMRKVSDDEVAGAHRR
ncbi:MAG: hypothetical protein ACI8XO_000605 [Verrucomicrobiales bacterium]|jgi:hypothetical protein